MARLIQGDREVLNQVMFGTPDPVFQQYIQETNNQFRNTFTDIGNQFVESSKNLFARLSTCDAMRIAKAALRKANTYFQEDVIYYMNEVSELQEAPQTMVRWVMCHPQLRQLNNEHRIEAYGERYFDQEPDGHYGWGHCDYDTVYSGWVNPVIETKVDEETKEETKEYYMEYVTVLEDELDEFEVPLLSDEEADMVIQAHTLVDKAIAERIDPTSYYDNLIV